MVEPALAPGFPLSGYARTGPPRPTPVAPLREPPPGSSRPRRTGAGFVSGASRHRSRQLKSRKRSAGGQIAGRKPTRTGVIRWRVMLAPDITGRIGARCARPTAQARSWRGRPARSSVGDSVRHAMPVLAPREAARLTAAPFARLPAGAALFAREADDSCLGQQAMEPSHPPPSSSYHPAGTPSTSRGALASKRFTNSSGVILASAASFAN